MCHHRTNCPVSPPRSKVQRQRWYARYEHLCKVPTDLSTYLHQPPYLAPDLPLASSTDLPSPPQPRSDAAIPGQGQTPSVQFFPCTYSTHMHSPRAGIPYAYGTEMQISPGQNWMLNSWPTTRARDGCAPRMDPCAGSRGGVHELMAGYRVGAEHLCGGGRRYVETWGRLGTF